MQLLELRWSNNGIQDDGDDDDDFNEHAGTQVSRCILKSHKKKKNLEKRQVEVLYQFIISISIFNLKISKNVKINTNTNSYCK